MIRTVTCRSTEDTRHLGRQLGEQISKSIRIALQGDLGSGKTTLVQGLAKGLGVSDRHYVTSPTYAVIHEFPARIPLYHLDLYRLDSFDELIHMGIDDLMASEAVMVVEWPGILMDEGIAFDLEITLNTRKQDFRDITLKASGLASANLLRNLSLSPTTHQQQP